MINRATALLVTCCNAYSFVLKPNLKYYENKIILYSMFALPVVIWPGGTNIGRL